MNAAVADTNPPAVWKKRSLLFLLAGQFVSLVGLHLTEVALPWFVLTTTGSPAKMATVLFAETLPFALFGLPAGVLVDRLHLKRLMVTVDVLRGLTIAAVPTLHLLGMLDFWMIVAAAAVSSTLATPYIGARMSILPCIVGECERDLTQANSLWQMAMQSSMILGPVLAGALIPVLGNANVLFLDAGSYAIAAMLIGLGVRYVPAERPAPAGWLAEIREGVRYAVNAPAIRNMSAVWLLSVFGFYALLVAALPVFTERVLHAGADSLGLMLGAWGFGALGGLLVYGRLAAKGLPSRTFAVAVAMTGLALPLWIPPLTSALVPSVIAFFISGACDGPLGVMVHTILQTETPPAVRGRVTSAFVALTMLAAPVAMAISGPVLEHAGALPVMYGVAFVFTALAGALWLAVRRSSALAPTIFAEEPT